MYIVHCSVCVQTYLATQWCARTGSVHCQNSLVWIHKKSCSLAMILWMPAFVGHFHLSSWCWWHGFFCCFFGGCFFFFGGGEIPARLLVLFCMVFDVGGGGGVGVANEDVEGGLMWFVLRRPCTVDRTLKSKNWVLCWGCCFYLPNWPREHVHGLLCSACEVSEGVWDCAERVGDHEPCVQYVNRNKHENVFLKFCDQGNGTV